MAYAQIRINKTPAFAQILTFLQQYYPVMSDTDLLKLGVSELYAKIQKEKEFAFSHALASLPLETIEDPSFSLTEIKNEERVSLSREEMWKSVR